MEYFQPKSKARERQDPMKNNMKFEDALASLDDIVKKLEANSLSLDESLEAFDKAIKLIKFCNQKLDFAEQKVRILTEGDDGTVTDMPFENISNAT